MSGAPADLLIRNLRPWDGTAAIDLAVRDGRFIAAAPGLAAKETIDAGGRLAVPGFIDPHIHLDKVMINRDVRPNASGTLTEAIEIIWEKKKHYTVEDIVARAAEIIESAEANGVTRLGAEVHVDTIGGLTPIE